MTKKKVGQYFAHSTIAALLLTSTVARADVFSGPIAVPYIALPSYAGPIAEPPPPPPTQTFTFVEQPLPPSDGDKPHEPPPSFPPPSVDPIPSGPMIPAVPEPSTWIMMIIGFCGLAGIAHRRRNRKIAIRAT